MMEKLTDWERLWEDLSLMQIKAFKRDEKDTEDDFWQDKAKKFDKMVADRWQKPDSSRMFLADLLENHPGSTLLDVGAGTGKWAVYASNYAKKVTAFEPSSAMQSVLKEKIAQDGISNIDIVTGTWPDDDVAVHDYVLASHSMYGVADFKGFVNRMCEKALKGCIMLLRVPFADSIMAVAAKRILGQPYDSPNFQIAYNILLGMDIYPDVIMEADGSWPGWTSRNFEAALAEVKNRLGVRDRFEHDDFLTRLLRPQLKVLDGKVVWPAGNRSALVYWEVGR